MRAKDRIGFLGGVTRKDSQMLLCCLDQHLGIEMLGASGRQDRTDADLVSAVADGHAAGTSPVLCVRIAMGEPSGK